MSRLRDAVHRLANNRAINNPVTNNPVTRFVGNAIKTLANDPSLQQWFGHGVNEVANMVLHGQPAPIYARSASPKDQEIVAPHVQQEEEVTVTSHGPAEPAQAVNVEAPVAHSEVSAEAPTIEPVESMLEQTMHEIEQTPELNHPEQEMYV